MTPRVFISHSHDDKSSYSSLCLALEGSGVRRRGVSELSPGNPLADALRAAIEQCDVCVFLATTRSIKSPWCLAELGAFCGSGKKVIMYLADPQVKEDALPPQFRGNLWTADARQLIKTLQASDTSIVRQTTTGYLTCLGTTEIHINFGRIEELACKHDDCLIASPANEFFDDDCITDTRSSLEAFMQHHFRDGIPHIQNAVQDALAIEQSHRVEKKPGQFAFSYGVGKCVFLDRPLGQPFRIAMVAVTTQRADVGLRANASYIFEGVSSLQRVMANNRMTRLQLSILGSGHGGLKGEVSLLCMLISLGDLYRKRLTRNMRVVKIVVFKPDDRSPPSIPEAFVRRALEFTSRCLVE